MNPSMKLSQPKSARSINTARVLSSLRLGENLSKAELARLLELNKVSVGEIVDSLLANGFVEELGKMEAVNGRKPTALKLVQIRPPTVTPTPRILWGSTSFMTLMQLFMIPTQNSSTLTSTMVGMRSNLTTLAVMSHRAMEVLRLPMSTEST